MNNKTPLDIYDDMPKAMKKYIANYGWHFNKKAFEYAVSYMKIKDENSGTSKPLKAISKDEIDKLLLKYSIELDNNIMYDYVYIANMCKSDFLGKSIPDERHLVLYVKDTIDDVDASDTTTFRRWVATMIGNGTPIDWDEIT